MTKKEIKNLLSKSDWNEKTIEAFASVIDRISEEYLGLDTYPNQFEIVSSEQLLDTYSLIGLPISYDYWKFGKDFVMNQNQYQKGKMGLSYEMVINSNPCISYNLEDNDTCLMTLVYSHVQGHNSFFKNNYLFKQWTQADAIIDYMLFAKNFISKCEERYGYEEVEMTLDACHALMNYGVDKYKKPRKISSKEESVRLKKKIEDDRVLLNDIWRTIPSDKKDKKISERYPKQPEENILYFIEKNSPKLKEWQREIVRIVRKTAQYFYPQGQTKVSNEGFACICHYEIINKMYDEGYLTDGFMLEFLHHHSSVIYQPNFDSKYYSGINPYALGFNIFSDIKRMSINPTDEDRQWFPDIAGNTDWQSTIKYIMENFKDESFILQYLSPKVIRDMKLFLIEDKKESKVYEVGSIHNENGYKSIRKKLSEFYDRSRYIPDIQVYNVDVYGDRTLTLEYTPLDEKDLNIKDADKVLGYVKYLWGFPTKLIKRENGKRYVISSNS